MIDSRAAARARSPKPTRWRPLGTVALITLNACVFGLQFLWGATDSPPMLAAMGGMLSTRISDGQWWRLFSCTVLHGGLLHVAVNSYVLFVIGAFVERVLGTGRFVVLYVLSGVIASVGSFVWTDAVSVGASGAVFGLLAAQGVLAFFPRGLLPANFVPAARKAATTNLVLNLGISFLPNIDAAAHFTGALAGAALVYFGVVTPKVSTPPAQQWRLLRRWLGAGVLTGFGYAGVALVGITQGRPWLHSQPIEFAPRAVPGLGQTRQLPTFLGAAKADAGALVFGDIYEPYVLFVGFQPHGGDSSDVFHQQVRAELRREDGALGEPETTSKNGSAITCLDQQLKNGFLVQTCLFIDGLQGVRLEGGYWPGTEERFGRLTRTIAGGWQSPSASSPVTLKARPAH